MHDGIEIGAGMMKSAATAKPATEIGRVAALRTAHDPWIYHLPAPTSSAVYAQTPVQA